MELSLGASSQYNPFYNSDRWKDLKNIVRNCHVAHPTNTALLKIQLGENIKTVLKGAVTWRILPTLPLGKVQIDRTKRPAETYS